MGRFKTPHRKRIEDFLENSTEQWFDMPYRDNREKSKLYSTAYQLRAYGYPITLIEDDRDTNTLWIGRDPAPMSGLKKIRYEGRVIEVLDETPTHYVCPPESILEGYHFIPRERAEELDYYKQVAAELCKIPYDNVTPRQRVIAKQIVYFELYGGKGDNECVTFKLDALKKTIQKDADHTDRA